jgi:hypothetical protein
MLAGVVSDVRSTQSARVSPPADGSTAPTRFGEPREPARQATTTASAATPRNARPEELIKHTRVTVCADACQRDLGLPLTFAQGRPTVRGADISEGSPAAISGGSHASTNLAVDVWSGTAGGPGRSSRRPGNYREHHRRRPRRLGGRLARRNRLGDAHDPRVHARDRRLGDGRLHAAVPADRDLRHHFSLAGFQGSVQRGIELHVNDRLEVNGTLQVGALTDTIEVVGGSTLIQYTPQVQTLMGSTQVQELPLNNRNFIQLATLVPA